MRIQCRMSTTIDGQRETCQGYNMSAAPNTALGWEGTCGCRLFSRTRLQSSRFIQGFGEKALYAEIFIRNGQRTAHRFPHACLLVLSDSEKVAEPQVWNIFGAFSPTTP